MTPFDKFDGEILNTFLEVEITVSYHEESASYSVFLGSVDITSQLDPDIVQDLGIDWDEANRKWRSDDIGRREDMAYSMRDVA